MFTQLVKETHYSGLFCNTTELVKPEDVEIIGVLFPVDPGMVAIVRKGKLEEVPTFALKSCPRLDFGAMLTEKQIEERKSYGGLIGAGLCVGNNRTLLPLEQCKIKKGENNK